ncbi:hypothetical protein IAU60_006932 [Kwoniella sp. DSM 27419]
MQELDSPLPAYSLSECIQQATHYLQQAVIKLADDPEAGVPLQARKDLLTAAGKLEAACLDQERRVSSGTKDAGGWIADKILETHQRSISSHDRDLALKDKLIVAQKEELARIRAGLKDKDEEMMRLSQEVEKLAAERDHERTAKESALNMTLDEREKRRQLQESLEEAEREQREFDQLKRQQEQRRKRKHGRSDSHGSSAVG